MFNVKLAFDINQNKIPKDFEQSFEKFLNDFELRLLVLNKRLNRSRAKTPAINQPYVSQETIDKMIGKD